MKGQKGFALVLTLLVTALLLAVTAEFVGEVYVDTTLSHNFVAGQQASLLAASGVDGGIALLSKTLSSQAFTSLADAWAKPLILETEAGGVTVTIEEESGKLNLNKIAPPTGELLESNFYFTTARRLAKELKLSGELWEALADWVDGNDEPHPTGGESAYYGGLKPPCTVKNALLDTVEELGLVKGFDENTIAALIPFVTVYGDEANVMAFSPVNINTVPKSLLTVMHPDMTPSLAERVMDHRSVTPFKHPSELTKVAGMETIGQALQVYISVKGKVFRIRSEARVGEARRVVEAVVRAGDAGAAILYWREY